MMNAFISGSKTGCITVQHTCDPQVAYMFAAPITAPLATVRFPTDPVFSDIQAIFRGCVEGQDATTTAAKYLADCVTN
jgi:predicted solute-binding protein